MMDCITVIFKFLDFLVVVGLVLYGIRHYVVPLIEKLLREYGVFIYNLESDCKNLQLQTQSIYENIQDQDRQFQSMQAKFAVWQKKCDEHVILQKTEQQAIGGLMQNRFVTRSACIQQNLAIKHELPLILDSVTKTLQLKYQKTDEQKQYIETLIDVMKEQS